VQAPPPPVRDVDVDVDIVDAAEAMMMSMVVHTSSLLTEIELVRKPLSADRSTHSTRQGVLSLMEPVEARVDTC
jgi:hypothetical protein